MERFKAFCFGFGYVARRWAMSCEKTPHDQASWEIVGTGTNPTDNTNPAFPFPLLQMSGEQNLSENALHGVTHFLVSVPPDKEGDPVFRMAADALEKAAPQWVGYFSTTGVYGDTGGRMVDEHSPLRPTQERSKARVRAEEQWGEWASKVGARLTIFRLAGIYGPNRSVFSGLRAGTARQILKPGHVFSRIHVDDIARAVHMAINTPDAKGPLNVCDDDPTPLSDVVNYACTLLGITPPPPRQFDEISQELSPMACSFWSENRRVSNAHLKTLLGGELRYPTYREGLKAVLAEENRI